MGEIKAALFDLDGTLIDSLWVWERIDIDFLRRRGLEVTADYTRAVSTLNFMDAARYTVERFSLPQTPEEVVAEWNGMAVDQYANHVPLKPGARAYLEKLRDRGVLLATATALHDELALPVLKNTGVFELFDGRFCTDAVGRSKEHPDIFLHAARALGVLPEQCVMFEDLLPCIRGAKGAGLTVCGVYDPGSAADEGEIRREADYYLRSFVDAPLFWAENIQSERT